MLGFAQIRPTCLVALDLVLILYYTRRREDCVVIMRVNATMPSIESPGASFVEAKRSIVSSKSESISLVCVRENALLSSLASSSSY